MSIPTSAASIIAATLSAHGASDLNVAAMRTAAVESSGNASAKNPRSSATGLFQFTRGTWDDVMPGIDFSQAIDPKQNTLAFIRLTRRNEKFLIDNSNIEDPEDWQVYLAHFAGPGTAVKVLNANDNTALSEIFSEAAMKANPHLGRLGNVGSYKTWVQAKFNGQQLPYLPEIPMNGSTRERNNEDWFFDEKLGARAVHMVNQSNASENDLVNALMGVMEAFFQKLFSFFSSQDVSSEPLAPTAIPTTSNPQSLHIR